MVKNSAGSKGDTDVKNRLLNSLGQGKGGMIWENNIEIHILPYVKQMTSASSMHGAEHPKPVLWDNPRGTGWRGRWEAGSGFEGHGYTCG